MTSRLVACGLLSAALIVPALAQTTSPPATSAPPPAASVTTVPAMQGDLWRASKVVGLKVYDDKGDRIGEINEILLNKAGQVAGVVLGVGGFLGRVEARRRRHLLVHGSYDGSAAGGPRMNRRILVVEDHEDNRRILRDLLGSVGYEMIEAQNGEDAIRIARSDRPDRNPSERWISPDAASRLVAVECGKLDIHRDQIAARAFSSSPLNA